MDLQGIYWTEDFDWRITLFIYCGSFWASARQPRRSAFPVGNTGEKRQRTGIGNTNCIAGRRKTAGARNRNLLHLRREGLISQVYYIPMGRTKLNPQQNLSLSFISGRPNLLYWRKTDQVLPPSIDEGKERAENIVSSSSILPQEEADGSYAEEAKDSVQIIQSSRIVLLLEDHCIKEDSDRDSDRGISVKCIICNHEEKDYDRSTLDDGQRGSPNASGSKIAAVDGSFPLVSYELNSSTILFQKEENITLSIYCTDRTVTEFHLRDENSLAVLLSLCIFLSPNNNIMCTEKKNADNEQCSIHDNLMNVRKTVIQPLLSAITQELLEVVVKLQLTSSPRSSSTSSSSKQYMQDICYYSTPSIHVEVQLTTKSLERCHPNVSWGLPSKSKKSKCANIILMEALALLFPGTIVSDLGSKTSANSTNTSITAKMFYNSVDNANHNNNYWKTASHSTIPGLLPTLRPYQEAAVRWMISREQINANPTLQYDEYWKVTWVVLLGGNVLPLHQYPHLNSNSEHPIFYNPFTGCICISINEAREATATNTVRGGILAESMGLGKTVEVLACILSNPCPTDFPHSLQQKFHDSPNTDIYAKELKNSEYTMHQSTAEARQGCSNKETDCYQNSGTTTLSNVQHRNTTINEDKKRNGTGRRKNFEGLEYIDDAKGMVCFCGRADFFLEGFGWVRCESCEGYMHGSCADFVTYNHMVEKTFQRPGSTSLWCSATRCPCCVGETINSKSPIHSRATIIITPPAILDQWQREIRRHVSLDLKVIIYPGIREMCSKGKIPDVKYCHVKNLADADIILTTFPSLMADLHHSVEYLYEKATSLQESFRKRKRYRVIPSPLPSVLFWRCCLDEAQRIEAPTAASAKMALKLLAVNKWCVTGTPIGRGKLEDLFGLLLFLGMSPFNDKPLFKRCFQSCNRGSIERLQFTLSDIFWRSTKANSSVRQQLDIPEQVEHKSLLKFSSVEKHFYQIQLEETILAASQVTQDYEKGKGFKKLKVDEHVLSINLQRLRAACCHPQVGSGGIGRSGNRGCGGTSLASGVLTMDQILNRLIDDAKTKCEEAQRVAVMHSNAIASFYRLKVDARNLGFEEVVDPNISDLDLLKESAKVYTEALELTKTNAVPCEAVGESTLTGCIGFLAGGTIVRNGKATLMWHIKNFVPDSVSSNDSEPTIREIWARFDFEGPAKKLTAIKIRQMPYDPQEVSVKVLLPKTCLLQVSNAAVGGEFVDVCEVTLPQTPSVWGIAAGFRTNKSRSWKIVVKDYYYHNCIGDLSPGDRYAVGLEVQLSEPEIGVDDLQRIHITHNASLVLKTILSLTQSFPMNENDAAAIAEVKMKLSQMETETSKLEELYLGYAILVHRESRRQVQLAIKNRQEIEESMRSHTNPENFVDINSIVENVCLWWSEFLSWCRVNHEKYVTEFSSLVHQTKDYLSGFEDTLMRDHKIRVPEFSDLNGLHAVLHSKMMGHASKRKSDSIIQKVACLLENPTEDEITENSQCGRCRTDFGQRGPVCQHCRLEDDLKMLDGQVNDYLCFLLLRCVGRGLRESTLLNKADERFLLSLKEKAKIYHKWQDARKQEIVSAKLYWKVHFNLLSAIDELNQCKRTISLFCPVETHRTGNIEANDAVPPNEIQALIWDHYVKQAMAIAQLKRDKSTLRYLRNQIAEREGTRNVDKDDAPTCMVCLCTFGEERAVLSCGHCFHYSPCIEQLLARSGGGTTISCPMRCNTRTNKDQIMIASSKNKNDGSSSKRNVNGSWGTKVERLVGDLLDVIDIGEKCIVFSQWEDLLTIVEQALIANQIEYVRPKSQSGIGASAKKFRGSDIPVLTLNVKCGAEGLSLIEATHVFMVEPLLHCGLDAQAINRVHRIGQKSVTHVHRYIMEDTIEVKIDALRMEMQETHEDDELGGLVTKDSAKISAGGIDGGFSASQLKEILK